MRRKNNSLLGSVVDAVTTGRGNRNGRILRVLDVDWLDVIKNLKVWNGLSLETRQNLLEQKPSATFQRALVKADAELLEESGFLLVSGRGRVRWARPRHPFVRLLRSLHRIDMLRDSSLNTAVDYLREHYTIEQRFGFISEPGPNLSLDETLAHSIRHPQWMLSLLRADDDELWDSDPEPEHELYVATSAADAKATKTLVALAMKWPSPVPLADLPELASDLKPNRLAGALTMAVRNLTLFPMMSLEDLTVMIGLWPTVTAALHRPRPKPPAPLAEPPPSPFRLAVLMEDMALVAAAARAAPLRLRGNDGELYAAAKKELRAALLPLPPGFKKIDELCDDERIDRARQFVEGMGTGG